MKPGKTTLATLLALTIGSFPGLAMAQNSHDVQRSISVTGQGEASGNPDQARISAGVQTKAKTVNEASRDNQAAVERIMQALEQQGIDERDIQTSNYSIWPEQRNDPRNNDEITITGFRVTNTVNVTVNDIGKVGEVLAAVTNAGANTIQGVNFSVRDETVLEQKARAGAMENARTRAEELAALAGVELGEVLTISMSSGGGHPMPMMANSRLAAFDAAPTPGISPGQSSVSVQVQVTFGIR